MSRYNYRDGFNFNDHLYTREKGSTSEELRRFIVQDDNSYPEIFLSKHKLGKTLLLIMKTLTILDNKEAKMDCRQIENIEAASRFLHEIGKNFSENNDTYGLFVDFLHELYFDYYINRFCDQLHIDVEYAYLKTIYNYILLCMENINFYTLENFDKLSIILDAQHTSPRVSFDEGAFQLYLDEPLLPIDLEYLMREKRDSVFDVNVYDYHRLTDICLASIRELISSGFAIKACAHCGEWFIEYSKNEKYCSIECRNAENKKKALARMSAENEKMLKSIRQMLYSKTTPAADTELMELNKNVKEWRRKMKAGQATDDEFGAWLRSQYKRKYKPKQPPVKKEV